jgi:hypothetical protein
LRRPFARPKRDRWRRTLLMAQKALVQSLTDADVELLVYRATRAKALLGDEILRECFETAEKATIGEWILAKSPQEREGLHAQLLGLRRIVLQLRKLIGDGTYEQEMRKRHETRANPLDTDTTERGV